MKQLLEKIRKVATELTEEKRELTSDRVKEIGYQLLWMVDVIEKERNV